MLTITILALLISSLQAEVLEGEIRLIVGDTFVAPPTHNYYLHFKNAKGVEQDALLTDKQGKKAWSIPGLSPTNRQAVRVEGSFDKAYQTFKASKVDLIRSNGPSRRADVYPQFGAKKIAIILTQV
jgi:hypothetical protein